jgi:hypothetical protein
MGIEIGDQAWGGVVTTLQDVEKLYQHIQGNGDSLFVWSWLKAGPFEYKDIASIVHSSVKRSIEQVDQPTEPPPAQREKQDPLPEIVPTVVIPTEDIDKPEPSIVPPFIPCLPKITGLDSKAPWCAGMILVTNDLVVYKDMVYKTRANHTTQIGWEPDKTLALFMLCKDTQREEWIASMEYEVGEKVSYKYQWYTCVIGHVSQTDWAPDQVELWKAC